MTAPAHMTPSEIASLAELERKATPTPWDSLRSATHAVCIRRNIDGALGFNISSCLIASVDDAGDGPGICISEEDRDLIAAARNAVPRLIATIAARDAENERMKWALTQARVDLAACAMIEAAKSHGLLRADGLRQTIAKIDAALKEIRNV